MPTHSDITDQAYEAAVRLIDQSRTGETDGSAIAHELGLTSAGDKNTLYHALFVTNDEGQLRCDFPGGMELPPSSAISHKRPGPGPTDQASKPESRRSVVVSGVFGYQGASFGASLCYPVNL